PRAPLFQPPPTTPTSPLSLHAALPIWDRIPEREHAPVRERGARTAHRAAARANRAAACRTQGPSAPRAAEVPTSHRARTRAAPRSEEHTSELQSRENLVCRLLLEKKKK